MPDLDDLARARQQRDYFAALARDRANERNQALAERDAARRREMTPTRLLRFGFVVYLAAYLAGAGTVVASALLTDPPARGGIGATIGALVCGLLIWYSHRYATGRHTRTDPACVRHRRPRTRLGKWWHDHRRRRDCQLCMTPPPATGWWVRD